MIFFKNGENFGFSKNHQKISVFCAFKPTVLWMKKILRPRVAPNRFTVLCMM